MRRARVRAPTIEGAPGHDRGADFARSSQEPASRSRNVGSSTAPQLAVDIAVIDPSNTRAEADPWPERHRKRVHMAAGRGLCLGQTSRGGAFTFDDTFQPRHEISVSGIPSRARVSPDGRYGAMTVFVRGHSYAAGGFSTQTTLVDMATGTMLGAEDEDGDGGGRPGLESFAVYRDGSRFEAEDANFWGVTFARDGDRFYATLGSGGKTYLIEGDIAGRQARILAENVECPSLSPSGTRLAYKKRVGGGGLSPIVWRLHLLDLATMTDAPLAEARNVDDQVEWLDEQHILYSLPDEDPSTSIRPDIWQLALDGSAARRIASGATSPAVVR